MFARWIFSTFNSIFRPFAKAVQQLIRCCLLNLFSVKQACCMQGKISVNKCRFSLCETSTTLSECVNTLLTRHKGLSFRNKSRFSFKTIKLSLKVKSVCTDAVIYTESLWTRKHETTKCRSMLAKRLLQFKDIRIQIVELNIVVIFFNHALTPTQLNWNHIHTSGCLVDKKNEFLTE